MRLADAPVGLFVFNGELCLKTEYIAEWGVEAYIVSSGETFWGGAKTAEERNNLDVTPVEVDIVKRGKWVDHMVRDWRCSECGEKINKVRNVDGYCYDDKPNYCPNCGADMRNT